MLSDLKPYSDYKECGLPWLGKVPTHWNVKRGKALFNCVDVRSKTGDEELLTVSSERGVVPRSSANVTMFKAESYAGYKLCWPGDLVINSLWAWGRGLGVSRHHGIVSSAYGVYRLRAGYENYSAHIHELVRSSPFHWELQVRSKGIWISRLQLTDDSFLTAPFPVPPDADQLAIVRFLDHADGKIRKYIRAKQKLIKLLEEQKQAIIDQAVTRGLDPNVKLKPSGVECLGDVPLHWNVSPLKTCVVFQEGPGIMRVDFRDAGVPLLRISCLLSKDDPLCGCNFLDPDMVRRKWAHFSIQPGDYIVNASTSASTILICKAKEPMFGAIPYTGLIRLWPRSDEVGMEYVGMLFQARVMQEQLLSKRSGVGIAHFGPSHLRKVWIALPPRAEQVEIVRALTQGVGRLEAMKRVWTDQVERVRELQTRLIADVVTGKIDVRKAAAALPDEPAEVLEDGELEAQNPEDADMGESEAEEVAE